MTSIHSQSIHSLSDAGVSVWLDDLGRERLVSGELARLVAGGVKGVTTNPSIFAAAVSTGTAYAAHLASLRDLSPERALHDLMVSDVRDACDVLRDVYDDSAAVDGRVSLEVDPRLAFDTTATVAAASRIWSDVGRPNAMVKIPATAAGLPAITDTLAAGISVNVTLIFGVDRYREVQEAWLAGLEAARVNGHDLVSIGSVASFFVSRLDTAVDGQLDAHATSGALTTEQHGSLRGRAAVANARTAYRQFLRMLADPRWAALAAAGAQPQRPLWASTSTKDPRYPDTYYVEALVAPRTVNTLPPETFASYRDHGRPAVRIREGVAQAPGRFRALAEAGIDLAALTRELEKEGVAKFAASYTSLLTGIATKAGALAVGAR